MKLELIFIITLVVSTVQILSKHFNNLNFNKKSAIKI